MSHSVKSAIAEFMSADETASLGRAAIRRHEMILGSLAEVAGPSTPIARLTRADVDAVLADRRASGVCVSTLNNYRTSLRMFGAWLAATGYTKSNVAGHLRNGKVTVSRAKRKPITANQARQMIKLARERHPRDGATIALLIFTGCRGAEIAGLRWRDVDFTAGTISVYRSKVTDWLTLPMPADLVTELLSWRSAYGEIEGAMYVVPALVHRGFSAHKVPFRMSPDWPLAPHRPQTEMAGRIKRLLIAVGETDLKGRGTHTLRRTAANLILSATGDLRAAQHLLGHASVTQTEKYLDASAAAAHYNDVIRGWTL